MITDDKIILFSKPTERLLFERIMKAGLDGVSYDDIYNCYSDERDGQNFLKKMTAHKIIVRGTHAVFYLPPEDRQ